MNTTSRLSLLLLAALSVGQNAHAFGRAQSLGPIQAESAVPKDQMALLRQDFEWLGTLQTQTPTGEFREVLELDSASPADLSAWLSARVRYVVAENFKPSLLNIRPYIFKKFAFPKTEMPDLEFPPDAQDIPLIDPNQLPEGTPETAEEPQKQGKVVMANLGSALYLGGKMADMLLGVKLRGIGRVPVTSPRAGIIQIGEGLFDDGLFGEEIAKDSPIRRTFRMSTFFHEARHSDGNGKSLGFMHALCPRGHDYENTNACDRSVNGPYTVGALMDEHIAKACTDCSEVERETIRLFGLESRSRIIPSKDGSAPGFWNAAPEGQFPPRQ
jgi:hypothetical protein